jgi:hypothetical protein
MRTHYVNSTDLRPNDLLIDSGIAGIRGLVKRVSVYHSAVGVWLADGQARSLGIVEACTVMRETRQEVRP